MPPEPYDVKSRHPPGPTRTTTTVIPAKVGIQRGGASAREARSQAAGVSPTAGSCASAPTRTGGPSPSPFSSSHSLRLVVPVGGPSEVSSPAMSPSISSRVSTTSRMSMPTSPVSARLTVGDVWMNLQRDPTAEASRCSNASNVQGLGPDGVRDGVLRLGSGGNRQGGEVVDVDGAKRGSRRSRRWGREGSAGLPRPCYSAARPSTPKTRVGLTMA